MSVDSCPELTALLRGLSPEERSTISLLDLQRLKVEQAGVSAATAALMTEPVYGFFACLRMWCVLIQRMEQAWSTIDYYMVYEYLNDLTVRNAIEAYLDAMPAGLKKKARRAIARLDDRYAVVTVADGGAELANYWRPLAEGRECRWWWTRRPQDLPPGWQWITRRIPRSRNAKPSLGWDALIGRGPLFPVASQPARLKAGAERVKGRRSRSDADRRP